MTVLLRRSLPGSQKANGPGHLHCEATSQVLVSLRVGGVSGPGEAEMCWGQHQAWCWRGPRKGPENKGPRLGLCAQKLPTLSSLPPWGYRAGWGCAWGKGEGRVSEKPLRASEAQTMPGALVASSLNPMWVAPGTQLLRNIGSPTKFQVTRHSFLGT